ncbi:MAG TPA: T9SS type A sorting domain-containing protein, partial [Puia sp.]|nr:T9SS type A sorting domain-containing protein [Puia sp.]
AVSFTNSTMAMSNSASMSNNHSITFVSSTLTQDNSASIASSGAFDAQSSTLTLNSSASLASSSSLTIESGSNLFLNGASSLASSGTTTVQTNGSITIGDGSSTSTAKMTTGNSAVAIKDNSYIKISNSKNSYSSTASSPGYTYTSSTGTTTPYSTANQTYNCGTGYPNACSVKAVYGCATMNGSGSLACIVLAVADINLTATAGSRGSVDLSWSDAAASAATGYRIQRSSDGKSWIDLSTVMAGGYSTTGDYTFSDAGAPAGTIYYRINRIDKDGHALYSGISAITIAASTASIRLYPNPTTGRNFFIATPGTGQLVVDVYTMTGQLLTQTQLKGQTQYALQLPARVPAGSAIVIVIRTPSQGSSQTFTLLVR